MTTLNLTPDPEEIVQSEEDYAVAPFPVNVCGPVETRELPGIRAGYSTEIGIGTAVGVRLLTLEPRRKSAVIIPVDQDVWVSSSQSGAQSGAAGAIKIPKGTVFKIEHMDQVWAAAATGTTDVSVMTTYWSE